MKLDDGQGGRWLVEWATSVFELDLDGRSLRRSTVPGRESGGYHAVEVRGDGADLRLTALVRCRVGESMIALVEVLVGVSTIRISTPVRRIEPPSSDAYRSWIRGISDLTS